MATANVNPNAYVESVCATAGISDPEACTRPSAFNHSLGGGKNNESLGPDELPRHQNGGHRQ